jgi:hypothetical protein
MNQPDDLKRQKEQHKRQRRLRAQFGGTLTRRNRSVSPGYQFVPQQDDFNRWISHSTRN